MSQLTPKQQYQREYYRQNKESICAKKRSQYKPKTKRNTSKATPKTQRKTRKTTPKDITGPAKATQPVKKVDKMPKKTRHKIEDILLAKELELSVDELCSDSAF